MLPYLRIDLSRKAQSTIPVEIGGADFIARKSPLASDRKGQSESLRLDCRQLGRVPQLRARSIWRLPATKLIHCGRSGICQRPTEDVFIGRATRRFTVLEEWYNRSYTKYMKTAISIPDSLFEEADRLAKARGWSRSELYANAVTAYVNSERFSGVREKLDAVYGNNEEDSAIDPFLADAQARSLPREKW